MNRRDQHDVLSTLLESRGDGLLATATLLSGSRAAGEDLLQASLERLLRRWVFLHGEVEGYLRRTMYHLTVDGWRARTRRPEVLGWDLSNESVGDEADRVVTRRVLLDALAALPARQRAVLVLRYFEQLSEAEIAAALGCSVGTVKSSASRALNRLRQSVPHELGPAPEELV